MIPDATFNMPTEPTALQRAEDAAQEAELAFGLAWLRYTTGDHSVETTNAVELARQEWRRAQDDLALERAAAVDEETELPF